MGDVSRVPLVRRTRWLCVLAAFVVLAVAAHVGAEAAYARELMGTVFRAGSTVPVAGASVTLYRQVHPDDPWIEYDWVITRGDGRYDFHDSQSVPMYMLSASAWGYEDFFSAEPFTSEIFPVARNISLVPVPALVQDAYEGDDTTATASVLDPEDPWQEHTIYPRGDVDWISRVVTAGTTYLFDFGDDWNCTPVDLRVVLYRDGQTVPITELDPGDVWTAPSDGVIRVSVRARESWAIGSYYYDATEAVLIAQGTVLDSESGGPVRGANVQMIEYVAHVGYFVYAEAVCDDSGTFEIWDYELPEADINEFDAEARGYAGHWGDADQAEEGAPYTTTIELTPIVPDARGVVTDAVTGSPLSGVQLELYERRYEWVAPETYGLVSCELVDVAVTSDDGTYCFYDLRETGVNNDYIVKVSAESHLPSNWKLTFSGTQVVRNVAMAPFSARRLSSANRYSTAAKIAREFYDPDGDRSWPGVCDIVVASGEDRAAADPLAASGLCWAYDAPLVLVGSKRVPGETAAIIKEICEAQVRPVTVHIVGGVNSVDLQALSGAIYPYGAIWDRVAASGDRYDLAAAIARRMRDDIGHAPDVVLVANGADPAKYFDALALSPISARNGYPILLVKPNNVPAATGAVIAELKPSRIIIGGGPRTVSDGVTGSLQAERWSGSTRYTTALAIADKAINEEWLSDRAVGVAARLPDALCGGSAVGSAGGVLTLTDPATLTRETGDWLGRHKGGVRESYVFGGTASVSESVRTAVAAKLK